MYVQREAGESARGLRIGVAVAQYHSDITDALREAAIEVFTKADGKRDDLIIISVPGSFELPPVCQAMANRDDLDAVVAIGCVIRGETTHDQHIAQATSQALMQIMLDTGKPLGFGMLTCQTKHQARARAGGESGNKGAEAMAAAIETVAALRKLASIRERR
ncbi:MAG: 6,7-dimethyl-8-ribityllumazine synthase [Planctomycetota bacterium]|nr:6,7-dimethyl-8-ribityllumazine synthase [Planctomycetota bacterium]